MLQNCFVKRVGTKKQMSLSWMSCILFFTFRTEQVHSLVVPNPFHCFFLETQNEERLLLSSKQWKWMLLQVSSEIFKIMIVNMDYYCDAFCPFWRLTAGSHNVNVNNLLQNIAFHEERNLWLNYDKTIFCLNYSSKESGSKRLNVFLF